MTHDASVTQPILSPADMEEALGFFRECLGGAYEAGVIEPNAMVLATATRAGLPSARMALLKACDERGFVFYTNLSSRKGHELAENPQAALHFDWPEIGLRVIVEGSVEAVGPKEADAYFASRPLQSRIGAWASRQSHPLRSRAQLLSRVICHAVKWAWSGIKRPPFWSGFRVIPQRIYFDFPDENMSLVFPPIQQERDPTGRSLT